MDLLTPLITGSLLALLTGIQLWINKGRFDAIDRRFERVESEIVSLRERVEAEIAGLRSDILQVALAVTGRGE